jgi:H/ACA ribonucleoprotein complex subunit 4
MDIQKIKQNKTTEELLEFGVINLDKSSGPTSFNVSEFAKKQLKARKTSHFGTLDPKVTGVLPVAINRACKLAGYFLGEDKTYVGIMQIHEDIELEKIEKAIKEKFLGEIIQLPPLKSRVKRQERPRTIYEFKLLEKEGKNILFKVKCEGGTYIRKLCTDLGDYLKIGAHMLELRRTNAGIFAEHDKDYPVVSLYDFEKAVNEYKEGNDKALREMIIPGEIIHQLHPTIEIKSEAVKRIFTGSPIHDDEVTKKEHLKHKKDQRLVVFSKDQFIGMFKVIKEGNLYARSEFTMQPINEIKNNSHSDRNSKEIERLKKEGLIIK